MSRRTGIEWTDATWNPIRGCSRVSEGCRNCYAEKMAGRFSGTGQPYEGLTHRVGGEARWNGHVRMVESHLNDPIRWQRPRRIFVNSMSDLFHEHLTDEAIDRVFAVMFQARLHRFQILTKRPARMLDYVRGWYQTLGFNPLVPEPHIHLGVSVENQTTADERIQLLSETPAAVRWISAEPLLGPLDLTPWLSQIDRTYGVFENDPLAASLMQAAGADGRGDARRLLDWVVVGGESGPRHRPMEIAWVQSIVEQCRAHQVPVFVKQDSGARAGQQGRIPDSLWIKERP